MNCAHHVRRGGLAVGWAAAVVLALLTDSSWVEAQRAESRGGESAVAATEASGAGTVNIQSAGPEELQRLPGIGPSRAQAIVAQRERAPFRRVEDIMRVRGIGRATFRRLRPMLSVSGETTLIESVRGRARSRSGESEENEQE